MKRTNLPPPAKIAIVVPVYNVEKYLAECLQSLLNQTYQNWECFLIDDGSTDGSGAIIDQFASLDVRFNVLHKKNGGVSSARNAALNLIFGRQDSFAYLGFLDSDDRLPPNFLAEMVRSIVEKHTDMAMCSFIPFDKHGPTRDAPSSKAVLNSDELANVYFSRRKSELGVFGWFLMNKIFALDLVYDIYFDEKLKIAEDLDWFINVFPCIKSCVTVPTTHYQYRLRRSSLFNSPLRRDKRLDVFSRVLQTKEYEHFSPFVQPLIQENFIDAFYKEIKEDIFFNDPPDKIKEKIASNVRIAEKTLKQTSLDKKSWQHYSRLKNWPFFFIKWYFKMRNKKISSSREHLFD